MKLNPNLKNQKPFKNNFTTNYITVPDKKTTI